MKRTTRAQSLLYTFFQRFLTDFLKPDLTPLGRQIIECCMDRGCNADYEALIPTEYRFYDIIT